MRKAGLILSLIVITVLTTTPMGCNGELVEIQRNKREASGKQTTTNKLIVSVF